MNTSLVKGSIAAIAQQQGRSLAHSFVNVDCLILVDTSGSMGSRDSRGGRTRYDVACEELAQLQSTLPGKIGVLSFSSETVFCPNGVPVNLQGGTDLAGALQFAKIADVNGMRFVVISDGQPDEPDRALQVARTYQNRIDVIFVGSEMDGGARDFMNQLARSAGGVSITAPQVAALAATAQRLLSA